jgi:DNA adenine methylase
MRNIPLKSRTPRPFLKWAGGKSKLLPILSKYSPPTFANYHEPFIGGGALFFHLFSLGNIPKAFLSDINKPIIDAYLGIFSSLEKVLELLKRYQYNAAFFYKIRSINPSRISISERAARFIYLNKTCYNGIYRENASGLFNVPFGRHKNPTICDEPNLRAVSHALKKADISCRHFSTVLDKVIKGDFVYFDPPYHPLTKTANFTSYDRKGFGEKDQIQLRNVFVELQKRGVKAMLSNSDTPFIRHLYNDFSIHQVFASRSVNSKSDARGKVAEVIVTNY